MKKRLFIAIPLPETLRNKLMELEEEMAEESGRAIRFTSTQNLHVTVYFCGDTDEEKIPAIDMRLKEVTGRRLEKGRGDTQRSDQNRGQNISLQPVSLALKGVHFAPPNQPPRMIWAEFNGSREFSALVHAIYNAVREFPDTAEKPHPQPIPHITLARFHDPRLAQKFTMPTFKSEPFPVKTLELIASELAPGGSKYTVLYTYALV